MTVSLAQLDPLSKPDGSATYSRAGYTVLTAVNGPIEVQRKNELPEETSLEINIRPSSGVGEPRERHLEAILGCVLRRVVLVREHPRTLVQVTCQVLALPEGEGSGGSSSYLTLLPALLQSSILALLSACIPLSQTLSSTCIAVSPANTSTESSTTTGSPSRIIDPTPFQAANASSLHVLAFSSLKDHALLLAESEGMFDMDEYEDVYSDARARCCAQPGDTQMHDDGDGSDEEGAGGVGLGDASARQDGDAGQEGSEQMFVEKTIAKHVLGGRKWKRDAGAQD